MSTPETTQPSLTVRDVTVPRIGFGTWQITGRDAYDAVAHALELGYRHIDTARAYDNEREVGQAIADSGVPRDEIFLTTKIWMDDFTADRLPAAMEDSLEKLQVDHVDLVLLHWPNPDVPLEETLVALDEQRTGNRTRLVGVSNFPARMFERALELAPLATNQVEFHPYLGQDQLLRIAADHDVFVTAYAPLAHGKVADDPVLREIGEAHGKTPGQVALRYLLGKERVAVLPKSNTPSRRAENLDIVDFTLSADEVAAIDGLPKDQRDFSPGWAPDWDA